MTHKSEARRYPAANNNTPIDEGMRNNYNYILIWWNHTLESASYGLEVTLPETEAAYEITYFPTI